MIQGLASRAASVQESVVVTLALVCLVGLGVRSSLSAGPATTRATTQPSFPRPGDPGWDPIFDTLAKNDLPKDIPLPKKTPFDDKGAEQRDSYLRSYRVGFTDGVTDTIVIRCYFGQPPPAVTRGLADGQAAGRLVHDLRDYAARRRHFGYMSDPGSHKIEDGSPREELEVVRGFGSFAERFVVAIGKTFPQTLDVKVRDGPIVYSYMDEDYSRSNSDPPVKSRRFKASISLIVNPKVPRRMGADDDELWGEYLLRFDKDTTRWSLDTWDEIVPAMIHLQKVAGPPEEGAGGSYTGKDSKLALRLIGRAADEAQLKAEATSRPSRANYFAEASPPADSAADWVKYDHNPVLGGKLGTCFDVCVLKEDATYRMWFSWRPKKSVALVESQDGLHWSDPAIVLGPAATGWEDDINRPAVLKQTDGYHLWYTGQAKGRSSIGHATSPDGKTWTRASDKPVLSADAKWEKVAVMCPDVMWDEEAKQYRMWYSGGEQYEPDAIGYATSPDGNTWTKSAANPIFAADKNNRWEQQKVTACQVIKHGQWHFMFYIGFRDVHHAQIGIARSRDGITNWQRHPANPIISPTPNAWDHDAAYKPYALFDGKRWLLWYNGRHGDVEQIGVAIHDGEDLGFGN